MHRLRQIIRTIIEAFKGEFGRSSGGGSNGRRPRNRRTMWLQCGTCGGQRLTLCPQGCGDCSGCCIGHPGQTAAEQPGPGGRYSDGQASQIGNGQLHDDQGGQDGPGGPAAAGGGS